MFRCRPREILPAALADKIRINIPITGAYRIILLLGITSDCAGVIDVNRTPKEMLWHQTWICASEVVHALSISAQRRSDVTTGAGVSVKPEWRVKVTESMPDRAAPAVDQPRLVRLVN